MDEINLCMLAPEFFPVWGGTGTYIIELLKFLPENVNVHVVTLKRKIAGLNDYNLGMKQAESIIGRPLVIHYLLSANETFFYNLGFQFACFKRLPALLKKSKIDILHSHMSHMPDMFHSLFNHSSIPTVTTVHSTIQMQKDSIYRNTELVKREWSETNTLLYFPIINYFQKNYVKHVPNYIAVSNFTRYSLINSLDVEEKKITCIHNGVDTSLFNPANDKEIEMKQLDHTVVYVGRMIAAKGIHILLKAARMILKVFPKTRFLFVGGGNIEYYRELSVKLGLPEKNVCFVGHLGYFQRSKILRAATVFVNPSFFENCSMSILEAMSSGVAVVATDVGGNPEIIRSGVNGLLVPTNDSNRLAKAIIFLIANKDINQKMGAEARLTIETSFSAKKCAHDTFLNYENILNLI